MKTTEQKRAEAAKRQAEYDLLTTSEKLARLPAEGSDKQRAKLLKAEVKRVKDADLVEAKVVPIEQGRKPLKAKERRQHERKEARS